MGKSKAKRREAAKKGATRIICLLLAITMVAGTAASLLWYLLN